MFERTGFAVLVLLLSSLASAQHTARWIGPDGGLWSVGQNWDIGRTPVNDDTDRFAVVIDDANGRELRFDLAEPSRIESMRLGDARLVILPGSRLEVVEPSVLDGSISASGANTFMEQANPLTELRSGARLSVSDGARLRIAATEIAHVGSGSRALLEADGQDSRLELPHLVRVDIQDDTTGNSRVYSISATNGGHIDLSNVLSISGITGDSKTLLDVRSGGSLNLDSLESLQGPTEISIQASQASLPSLRTLDANNGIHWLTVGQGASLSLPALETMSRTVIETFGTIEASGLTEMVGSRLSVGADDAFLASTLEVVDGSHFRVLGGARLRLPARRYRIERLAELPPTDESAPYFWHAEGPGTVLDLASMEEIDFSAFSEVSGLGVETTIIDGATIDLVGTQSVQGPAQDHWLRFRLERETSETSIQQLRFGPARIRGQVSLEVGPGGLLTMDSLDLYSPARLRLASSDKAGDVGTLRLSGDLKFHHTDLSALDLSGGRLQVRDSHDKYANQEVAAFNSSLPSRGVVPEFAIGQLIVGSPQEPMRLTLVDEVDNGNRGTDGKPEALYLAGLADGANGLRILNRSTLYLNGIDVYVRINGNWHHLNAWIPKDASRVAFDEGFIARGDGDRVFRDRFESRP